MREYINDVGDLLGSDYPLITAENSMADFDKIAIRDEAGPLILRENAVRLLGLG